MPPHRGADVKLDSGHLQIELDPDPVPAEEGQRIVEVNRLRLRARARNGRATGRRRRRTRRRPRRTRPPPPMLRACSRAQRRRRHDGRSRAGGRRHGAGRGLARDDRRCEARSDAERRLDLVPGGQREEDGEKREHREDDPEARVRAACGVRALVARTPAGTLTPVRTLDGVRIERRCIVFDCLVGVPQAEP